AGSRNARGADCTGARTDFVAHPKTGARDPATQSSTAAEGLGTRDRCCELAARGAPRAPVIAYVDASVLLRVAFRQPDALPEWRQIDRGVSSGLVLTECLRTLDRLRLRASLPDKEVATRR